jgi:hypothetical protein
VIKTESQAVQNTLRDQDFQDAFKKWQKHWERCIRAEGDYFKGDGPKLVFELRSAPVPEIMDGSLYAPSST